MMIDTAQIRTESYYDLGAAILRETSTIIRRWEQEARAQQPNAARAHHQELLDHLPAYLHELGRSLMASGGEDSLRHFHPASIHGDQRWQAGWALSEVVRDFQILRVLLLDHLTESLDRNLTMREVAAMCHAIDDAIGVSVCAYVDGKATVHPEVGIAISNGQPEPPKVDFADVLALLGHELRNSLGPLTNAGHVLRIAGSDPVIVEQTLPVIERQVGVMVRLVDDLLDMGRLKRGKMSLEIGNVDLSAIVSEVVADLSSVAELAEVSIDTTLPHRPVWVTGDSVRLRQVIANLIGNALKFTDAGGHVSVSLEADTRWSMARFKVRDSGIGIAADLLPTLFDAFSQADSSLARNRDGLGLGLAIVKGLVELHGGRVEANSEGIGLGSEFVVELPSTPFSADSDSANGVALRIAEKACQILVIDDNQDFAQSLQLSLELAGHKVCVTDSGTEGVKLACQIRPDVCICDIGLRGMTGYDVCRELSRHRHLQSTLKIAISGHGSESVRREAMEAGFDVHLIKPISPMKVADVIKEQLQR